MSDLFEVPEVLSPKLAWLKKHRLATEQRDSLWACHNGGRTQEKFGLTEDEAILYYCEWFNLKHWTIE